MKKRIIVGTSGASGSPILIKCLELLREAENFETWLIMTEGAKLTLTQETDRSVEEVAALADHRLEPFGIEAKEYRRWNGLQ